MAMNCPNCGASNTDGSRFCEICGAQMGVPTPAAPQPPPPTAQQPAYPAAQQSPAPGMYSAAPGPQGTTQQVPAYHGGAPRPPKKKTGLIVGIVLAVALLAAVGTIVFLLLRDGDDPTASSSSSVPVVSSSLAPSSTSQQAAAVAPPVSEIMPEPEPAAGPQYIPPEKVTVSLDEFEWYKDYADTSGIPPNAKVIGDDMTRLHGTWKVLLLHEFEFENTYTTMSCDIEPSDQADALVTLYLKGGSGEEGWEEYDNELVTSEHAVMDGNLLNFTLAENHMAMLFWQDGNMQYGVCHFMVGKTPSVMMMMREI